MFMEETKASATITENTPLYSSNIISTFLQLIRMRYSYVNITELLFESGMEAYEVEDEGHWFTQEQVDHFYERLVRRTGNVNIAREAGRYTASPDAIGKTARWVLGFIEPFTVYKLIGKIAGKYTRSSVFESKRIHKTEIEIVVTPKEGVDEKRYQCENRKGYFEAIVSLFDNRLPKITHPECVFEGGKCCRYTISWKRSWAESFKTARNVSILSSGAVLFILALSGPWALFGAIAIIAASTSFMFTLVVEMLEKKEIRSALLNIRSTTEELLENTNLNYNHALMINEVGRIISKHNQTGALLSQVIEILRRRLDYDRGLIMLVNGDKTILEYKSGYGYEGEALVNVTNASFHLDKEESRGIFVLCYREKRPFLINDVECIKNELSQRSLDFLKAIGSKSFICCPILYEDECLGVLAVDNVHSKRPILESDKNLLMGIAPEIGISAHNTQMMEEWEAQFRSILRVLAASIDARDALTAGHSERVTEYSVAICQAMDLPTEYTEMIRVASQLHDYGKIGIKDSILKKSGPLSGREREEIKTHVVKTKKILDQINFKGIYQQVPETAGAHHERMDGSGYPDGLRGEGIPLGSRIIAVADFFEAITAQRHYRDPMTRVDAVQTLKDASGTHLDAEIVSVFLKILEAREAEVMLRPEENAQTFAAAAFRPEQAITGV
ncbi:MAG: hypothetical protein A2001_15530 [Treponema sp. GWC1_61_84]|nr:MAG: hypothetical protein A2001_15530 [Treponema sp. GWC1_61_84]